MRHHLSSRLTFVYKFLLPGVWLSGFSIGTIVTFVSGSSAAPVLALATALGFLLFERTSFSLKRVIAVDGGLLISNYSEEICVPYSDLLSVAENRWINIRPITLVLRAPSLFGPRIVFMPYTYLVFWRSHPALEFLQSRMPV